MNSFIIAGHNLLSKGAVAYNGSSEHEYTTALQSRIIEKATNYISLTGSSIKPETEYERYSLRQTIDYINSKAVTGSIGTDIHFNFDLQGASGTEIIVHPNTGRINKRRATFIVNEISAILNIPVRRSVGHRDYKYPGELGRGNNFMLAILSDTLMPFTVPEICFLNQNDLNKYKGNEADIADIFKKAYFSYSFNTQIPVKKPHSIIIGDLDPKSERRI